MSLLSLPPDWRDRLNEQKNKPRPRWMRVLSWVWLGMTAITVLLTVAVLILMNNARFHGYLIRTIESNVSESLGVPVHLENFAIHLGGLSADLYGITVEGAAPYANPPLLQVDHAAASVRIVSVLHRAWYLDNLQIDRPIAHVYVDEHGVSNIPTIKSSGNSNTSVFDLGIRHALVDRGEVYYNDKPSAINADMRDLEFRSVFDNSLKKYSGKLSYSDGHLVYGTFSPITHNLEAEFAATPSTFELSNCKLVVGASQALLAATLTNYSNPNVQGHYSITVDGKEVGSILHQPAVPVGTVVASGTVQFQQVANRALIDSLIVNGDISSPRLDVKSPSARASIANLFGKYSLINGDATLNNVHAELLGGGITAQGTMKNIGGDSHSDVKAAIHDVSIADLLRATGTSTSQIKVALSGRLNADATASWGKTTDDLVAHADATINGQATGASQTSAKATRKQASRSTLQTPAPRLQTASVAATTPANGDAGAQPIPPQPLSIESAIHATYTAKNGELALDKSYVRLPETNLTMNGVVSKHSSLNLQLQANDLREVESIADLVIPSSPDHPTQPLGLAGTASFQGNVQGSTSAPHLTGLLTASNLKVAGSSWKVIRTNVDVSPSRASLQNADLELASRGRITLSASTGLTKWSFTNTSPIQAEMHASQLDIAELARMAYQQVPVTGTLDAGLSLHGTELNPVGNGNVTLSNVNAYEQPIRAAKLNFTGDGQQVQGDLAVQLPTGSIQGKGSVRPNEKTYIAQVDATGIQLEKLEALKAKNVDMTGTVSLHAKGQGSFDNPGLDATVEIPKLVAQQQTVTGINLHMNVANHVANATLASSAVNTSIQAKAKIDLSGDYLADASFDTQGIPLQPLLAVYAPDQAGDITGQTELHATLHGPLKRQDLLEAHVTIPVFNVAYGKSIQLAAAGPIRADYKNGVVSVQRSSIRGTDTDLSFQGSIPTSGSGPMSLLLVGTVDLQLAQLFDPDVKSSGQLKFNIDSHGSVSDADIGGQINIVDANFLSPDYPVGLQHGNGVLKMTKDRLNIASFQGTVGGGTVTAQGGVAYRPNVQFDLGLAAKDIRVLYPQGMRENVEANLRLSGTMDNAVLGGNVDLSGLSFTPAFDLNSFIDQFSGGVAAPPSQGFAQNLQLNIGLRSASSVNLVSRTLSIGGTANLQVRGTAAEPVILGRVNLSSGDIILNGTRYVLNGGTIQFINPAETEPVVNVSLNTNIQQYSIDLRFQGPVDQLHTEYSSDPSLPSADIINLLAFGETTEASAQSTATTNQMAESLVASQVSSQVTSRLSKVAGISQLSVSPVLAGSSSQGPPGAVVTVQQRVTGNLFVNFSTNVASTQSQTIQGQYKISPKVSFSATRDPNGGFGFDALIKKSW
jgi:translocation and assembly module TamB